MYKLEIRTPEKTNFITTEYLSITKNEVTFSLEGIEKLVPFSLEKGDKVFVDGVEQVIMVEENE